MKIYEQLKNGNIKVFTNEMSYKINNNAFVLKISGVWETEQNYGVTYKFSKINTEREVPPTRTLSICGKITQNVVLDDGDVDVD